MTLIDTRTEINTLTAAAAGAFEAMRLTSDRERSRWLRSIAEALEANREELVRLADVETHLGEARLTGEVARTTGQLRLFASVLEEGSYLEATIDHAIPDATPPAPDLRRLLQPLGPVAVFSASNFPFAFSVAGGDTASALAAGCPVIVKGHSAHPRLSARTAELVIDALAGAGAPAGSFGHITGRAEGQALVQHPEIRAAGFTGSLSGGRALFDLAVGRPDPIPFYGELSAINPVVITSAAIAARGSSLASGLVQSFTMGVGQFCTKPGLVFVPDGSGFERLVVEALKTPAAAAMLTPGMSDAFARRAGDIAGHAGVELLAGSAAEQGRGSGTPIVVSATVETVLAASEVLLEEAFGPLTLLVRYRDVREALEAIRRLGGSLTASVHSEPGEDVSAIVSVLTGIAGRVLFDGWPTGVAVDWAQQHGGPWPSTTSSLHTSVGATSIRRWLRPVSYQTAPDSLLPDALKESNPLGIPRRIDGRLVLPA